MSPGHLVFDSHTHAFPDAIAARAIAQLAGGSKFHPVRAHTDGTVAGLLASMDRAGINRAILCSVATQPAQVRKITDWSAGIASERIIPFASIHPDFDQPEAEVERLAALKIRGLKFHPQYMNCPADDPRVLRIAKAAARAGLAMAFHAGYDLAFERTDIASPRRLRALHEKVPDLRLQACHLGGWEDWGESLKWVAGQRIWIETSFSIGQCPAGLLERIFEKHSPDLILFGTDSPWANQSADLAALMALKMSEELRKKVLWENGLALVGGTLAT